MTERPNPQEQKAHSLLIPFPSSKGTTIVKNLNKTSKNLLPSNVKIRITYTSQKLNSTFQIKDKINEKHKHDLIYYIKCSEAFCTEDYLGETGRRIIEQVANHAAKNKQSHLLKHALTRNHRHFYLGNMKIIDSSFHNNGKFLRQFTSSNIDHHYQLPVELKLFN